MGETVEEYKARLHGYVGRRDPMRVLRETPPALRKLILRKPSERLAFRPKPGAWSVVEILAHLAESEMVLGYRLRRILADPGQTIENIDQDRWAKAHRYAAIEPLKSVVRFREMRSWNLELLAGLTPEEWSCYGMHSERGRESVREMALLYAGHDLNHAAQIRNILGRNPSALPKAV